MDCKDKHLVERIQSGEKEAFEQLFFKYYEPLCQFACRYVHSMALAEDFVQEVFASVWDIHQELGTVGNIRSYLYRSAKNQVLDHIKHEEVVRKYEEEARVQWYDKEITEDGGEPVTKEGFTEAVQDAIEDLPDKTRNIYKLSRKEGFTYREISGILDISVKTVEAHMSKALRILRERVAPYLK
jgi:RNA polymerase sigma-70 factor (ECF subfamily)